MDKELRRWKRLAAGLFLALVFSGYVSYRQHVVIQKQRTVILILWDDLRAVAAEASRCISKT